jgi:putative ATP-dependent endonuclease of OLD family
MIIQSVHIQNFRSVMDETMSFANLTALVGSNGCGKSTFLRGLEVFYAPSPRVGVDDFYNRDAGKEIVIGVTFSGLSEEAKLLFENYMQGETLTVERVISWDEGKVSSQYHGASLQCPAFEAVRAGLQVKDRGKTAKEA